jgi:predicted RNA-binding Zn ribbon-like protein
VPVPRTPQTIHLWGGALCLDYANSVDWSLADEHVDPERTDVLRTQEMLACWGRRLGVLRSDSEPASTAELDRARALRDVVHRVFSAIGGGQAATERDLEALMGDYVEAVEHASLRVGENVYTLAWPPRDPRAIRYAVAADAISLLEHPGRLARASRCPGRDCGWLFLNSSGRRRWCSMSTCGSRDKMRRLHERRSQFAG